MDPQPNARRSLATGDSVTLHSLSSTHYNGLTGTLKGKAGARWMVKLADGRTVKIKAENLRRESKLMADVLRASTREEVRHAIEPLKQMFLPRFQAKNDLANGIENLVEILMSTGLKLRLKNQNQKAIYFYECLLEMLEQIPKNANRIVTKITLHQSNATAYLLDNHYDQVLIEIEKALQVRFSLKSFFLLQ